MATTLPVTFRASPLSSGFRGTPQQFLDALVARLSIESQDELSFFVIGSVAPSSDVGPWLKNGNTWWVWDATAGAYVPETLDSRSLRYVLSQTPPSSADYTIWIKVDGSGKAQSVQTYSSGAWHDVYEDTFAAMNANINIALNTYPAVAKLAGNQTVPVDTFYHKLLFNTPFINSGSPYSAANSRYVAPVAGIYRVSVTTQIDNDTAVAADMEMSMMIQVNGAGSNTPVVGDSTPSPNGARWYPVLTGLIQMSAGDYAEVWLSGVDGVNTGNVVVAPQSLFSIELVKAT